MEFLSVTFSSYAILTFCLKMVLALFPKNYVQLRSGFDFLRPYSFILTTPLVLFFGGGFSPLGFLFDWGAGISEPDVSSMSGSEVLAFTGGNRWFGYSVFWVCDTTHVLDGPEHCGVDLGFVDSFSSSESSGSV